MRDQPADRVTVRAPRADEIEALRDLAERTFIAAFAADNEPANLDSYVREAFAIERLRDELADPANTFLVATAGANGTLIGYGKLRGASPDPSVSGPDPIELERIYADPGAIGSGVGAALMRALLDEAVALGRRTIWLGVWERNARAIAFYRRWGFEVVGTHPFLLGADLQTDFVMERPLDEGASP